jgi:hypothetical protein
MAHTAKFLCVQLMVKYWVKTNVMLKQFDLQVGANKAVKGEI